MRFQLLILNQQRQLLIVSLTDTRILVLTPLPEERVLPILISNADKKPAQSPPQALLTITTSATGRDDPRSTLHQGSFAKLVCVQLPPP